jgi:hypothetical protein
MGKRVGNIFFVETNFRAHRLRTNPEEEVRSSGEVYNAFLLPSVRPYRLISLTTATIFNDTYIGGKGFFSRKRIFYF